MRATELTDKQARFIQLRANGWSYSDIAADLGISKGSCSNWARRYSAEIKKAADKLTEQKAEPLPKAPKRKAPRVIDITDKLSFNNEPDDLPLNHYLSPEFKERYERGELTEQEREGMEILKAIPEQLGQAFKKAAPAYDSMMKGVQEAAAEIGRTISAAFKQHADEISINVLKDIGLEKTFASLMASYKPLFEALEKQIKEYVESLPPEVREQLQVEIEQTEIRTELEKKERQLDKNSDRSGNPTGEIVTATVTHELFNRVYAAVLSGNATSQLVTINTTVNKPKVDTITGNALLQRGNFTLSIENYRNTAREFKVSTNKLLGICTLLLTESNHYREKNRDAIQTTVIFSLDDYMKLLGIQPTKTNKDNARKRIRADLDTLLNTKISWTERRKGKTKPGGDFLSIPIIGGKTGVYKGNVIVTFSKEMAEYLVQNAYLMQFSLELLKTDERNANVYPLGYKLLMHSSIDNNIKKGTADIISVQKTLEACPDIPKYAELQARGERHWERYIKEALEKALDRLTFMRWEYSNPKGEPLTNEQLAFMDYDIFISLYIHFELIDAPDQTKRLKAKAERAIKRKAKNDTKRPAKTEGASGHKSRQTGKGKE